MSETPAVDEILETPKGRFSNDPEVYMFSLQGLADGLAARFYCPIYLVGSFIDRGMDAADIDIIMVASEDRMLRLFRSLEFNERRYRFCGKQKQWFEDHISLWDVDFKVQSEAQFLGYTGKRVKLDKWAAEVVAKETK